MNIRKQIREQLREPAQAETIADVRIGLGYTAVVLEKGSTGLAFTFHRDMPEGCRLFAKALPFQGRPAAVLLDLLDSDRKVECAVGLATANALANVAGDHLQTADILDFIEIHPGDRVGMVGMFGPLIKQLRQTAGELIIFEKNEGLGTDLQPDTEIVNQLPYCNVALITATSIVNHSMDEFLHAAENCREVVILGATTPLLPAAFKNTPVTCLSGVVIADRAEVLRIVSSAGGMRQFKHFVTKVNLPLRA
ncbi:MAG: DUF364 domain-containing protein [Desulfosalsimonadaceae bacterium]